ncbi:MAG TPA: hypothetical protein VGS12_14475 [Caulobacteraceae bacterium]|nr:hypothetical protein [Caulobacteraceae bacterium]
MRHLLRATLVGVGAGALALAGSSAWAGCGAPSLAPATYQAQSGEVRFQPVSLYQNTIVGLWSVSFMAGGNQIDWGYSEWHADGTEIMNSGGHTPASGNFCLGVWRQTGPNTYHLKHFPLAYDPATGALAARIILTEDVTVGPKGDGFTGTFTLDVYDPTGKTLEQHVPGTITGRRVFPN